MFRSLGQPLTGWPTANEPKHDEKKEAEEKGEKQSKVTSASCRH